VTNSFDSDRRQRSTAKGQSRGRFHLIWDVIFGSFRIIRRHVHSAYLAFGIFLLSGAILALLGTWGFAELAAHVRRGSTQGFDDSVMRWMAAHQTPFFQQAMLEVTALGTGTVVTMVVITASMFLWLNKHKHSALLLIVATFGGVILNNLLKLGFDRPRPQIFKWGTFAMSSSFPSGHAMSSIIVYGTVAYLAARLQQRAASRWLTLTFATVIILLICASRVYLGVHYPSDIAAGIVIGLAWAGFCMAVLEATQLYAKRNAPQMLEQEAPAATGASPSS
jgi:undecaprenyl-diphosphatase